MSLRVDPAALAMSAQAWEDTSETVRGARKSLSDVSASVLGDRVEKSAQAFLDTWMDEISRLQTTAADHGDALREVSLLYAQSDSDVVDRIEQLLVWTDRNVSPVRGPR